MLDQERLGRIEERQSALMEKLVEMDEKLFGNGQPGLIELLRRRISMLEAFAASLTGGGLVLIFIIKYVILK